MNHPNILMLGDFNFCEINWEKIYEYDFSSSNSRENTQISKLYDLMEHYFLQQVIKIPTRLKNILDLLFTNNSHLISHSDVIINERLSDHNTVVTTLNMTIDMPDTNSDSSDLNDSNIPNIRQDLMIM